MGNVDDPLDKLAAFKPAYNFIVICKFYKKYIAKYVYQVIDMVSLIKYLIS